MSRYSPWAHLAARPHLRLTFGRLDGIDGFYDRQACQIVLEGRLRRVERRCALAHELAHADAGDTPPVGDWWEHRQEQHADRQAAGWLITVEDLADGLLWAQDEYELAEVLDVDVHTARARLDGLTEAEKKQIEARIRAREESA